MTDFDDIDDSDFEEIIAPPRGGFIAPVMVSIVYGRKGKAGSKTPALLFSFAADVINSIDAHRMRVDWNKVAGVFRFKADDMARFQINKFARSERRWVRVPFPVDDLYEHPGSFEAPFRLNAENRTLLAQAPRTLLEPVSKPVLLPKALPAVVPVRPPVTAAPARAHDVPLDDPKVVRAALGLSDDTPNTIGGQRFPRIEAEVVGLLAKRELDTKKMILIATRDPEEADEDNREEKLADVLICKIRPKLRSLGIAVETSHGSGYHLNGPHRHKLKTLIQEAREAAAS